MLCKKLPQNRKKVFFECRLVDQEGIELINTDNTEARNPLLEMANAEALISLLEVTSTRGENSVPVLRDTKTYTSVTETGPKGMPPSPRQVQKPRLLH